MHLNVISSLINCIGPGKICYHGYFGMLTHGQKSLDIYPHNVTKVKLSKWLKESENESTNCPICTVAINTSCSVTSKRRKSSSCGRCGFNQCVVCVMKSVLNTPGNLWNKRVQKCPNCRHEALVDLPEFSASLIVDGYLKKFTVSQQETIKTTAKCSRLYQHYYEQSKTVDPMSCSNCQRPFHNGKRLRCGACRQVFYCSKFCQADNWKRTDGGVVTYPHKPWCRMWQLMNGTI